jgi:RND family efflux transporter MFP subunit
MKQIISKIVLLALVLITIQSCGGSKKKQLSKEEELIALKTEQQNLNDKVKKLQAEVGKKDSVRTVAVNVMSATPSAFMTFIEVQGKIDANNVTVASPELPGVINQVLVKVGQYVNKGQTIATLKTTQVAGISDGIAELEQQISFAKTLYEKQQRLWVQEIGTEVQLLGAKNNYDALVKKRSSLTNQISNTKQMLSILAPSSGIVDAVDLRAGSAVMPGMPIGIRIVNTGDLKVLANIAENYGSKVTSGDRVMLVFPDLNDSIFTNISYVTKIIDPLTRTFTAQIPLRANGRYRPNMVVKAKIIGYKNDHAFSLPASLIQKTADGDFVFLSNAQGLAELRKVTTGESYKGQLEITSGLILGDNIITAGYEELNEGDKLQIIQ